MSTVEFEGHSPILRVADLTASVRYFAHVLGFRVDWQDGLIASVSRGRCSLFLSVGDQGHPGAWVWIGVSDVDALHAELSGKGALIRQPPQNFPWACEMQVADPDGNVLRMGSEPKEEPFGEWLTMHGDRWQLGADGQWTRVASASPLFR